VNGNRLNRWIAFDLLGVGDLFCTVDTVDMLTEHFFLWKHFIINNTSTVEVEDNPAGESALVHLIVYLIQLTQSHGLVGGLDLATGSHVEGLDAVLTVADVLRMGWMRMVSLSCEIR
jgi:hypothetical protein